MNNLLHKNIARARALRLLDLEYIYTTYCVAILMLSLNLVEIRELWYDISVYSSNLTLVVAEVFLNQVLLVT